MKNMDDIEEEYKEAYEALIAKFREGLKSPKTKKLARENFRKNLHALISKREKRMSKYIWSHKQEMLGLTKKKKVEKKKNKGPYKMYVMNFNMTFWEKIKYNWEYFKFHTWLRFRSFRYNFFPSKVKLTFYKFYFFLAAVWFDIKVFVNLRIFSIFRKIWKKIMVEFKEILLFYYGKVRLYVKKYLDARSKRIAEKKAKKEEAKQKAEEEKKKAEEAAKEAEDGEKGEGEEDDGGDEKKKGEDDKKDDEEDAGKDGNVKEGEDGEKKEGGSDDAEKDDGDGKKEEGDKTDGEESDNGEKVKSKEESDGDGGEDGEDKDDGGEKESGDEKEKGGDEKKEAEDVDKEKVEEK